MFTAEDVKLTAEDIKAHYGNKTFNDGQIKVMLLTDEGDYTQEEIANQLSSKEKKFSSYAIQRIFKKIYEILKIEGSSKGKKEKLKAMLRSIPRSSGYTAQKNSYAARKLVILYFSEEERNLSKSLGEIIVSSCSEIKDILIDTPIESGNEWMSHISVFNTEKDIAVACFLRDNLFLPLANSTIGFLSSKFKNFRFVYFGGSKKPEYLDSFEGIDGANPDEIAKVRNFATKAPLSDDNDWIRLKLDKLEWQSKVLAALKNHDKFKQTYLDNKIIKNDTSVSDIIKLLDDKTYEHEHKVIQIIVKEICPKSMQWLSKISKELIQDIKRTKQRVEKELLRQGFDVTPVNYWKLDPRNSAEKIISQFKGDNPLDNFPIRVCVLRVLKEENQSLEQKGYTADEDISYKARNTGDRHLGLGFIHMVRITGRCVSVEAMETQINGFVNKDWIIDNKLQSFMSFPVILEDKVKGTLSMYGGQEYAISEHPNHFFFVDCLVALISNLIVKLDRMKAIETLLSVNKEQFEQLESPNLPNFPGENEDLSKYFSVTS